MMWSACSRMAVLVLLTAVIPVGTDAHGESQDISLLAPNTDARSAAMGGVSSLDGDLARSLFANPGALGRAQRPHLWLQRATAVPLGYAEGTWESIVYQSSGLQRSHGLGFSEGRLMLAPADTTESARRVINRRLQIALGFALTPDDNVGLALSGGLIDTQRDGIHTLGFNVGGGFTFRPHDRLRVSPSVHYWGGSDYSAVKDKDRVTWSASLAAVDLGHPHLQAVFEMGTTGPGHAYRVLGAEFDLASLIDWRSSLQALSRLPVRVGVSNAGMSFGFGWEFAGLQFDYASHVAPAGRYSMLGFALGWGGSMVQERLAVAHREDAVREIVAAAEERFFAGDYEQAAEQYAMAGTLSDRHEFADLIHQCEQNILALQQADAAYQSLGGLGFARTLYDRLQEKSPGFELVARRSENTARIEQAWNLLTLADKRPDNRTIAWNLLMEVFASEPEQGAARQLALEGFPERWTATLHLDEVYPASYKHYALAPCGNVTIHNKFPFALHQVTGVVDFGTLAVPYETETIAVIPPDSVVSVPISVEFRSAAIRNIATRTHRNAHATIQTQLDEGQTYAQTAEATMVLNDPKAINWAIPDLLAGFVNPADPVVFSLISRARLTPPDTLADFFPEEVAFLYKAIVVRELIRQQQIVYSIDPLNPFRGRQSPGDSPQQLDTVNYPGETIADGRGDCDDLTVLWASALGSLGIASMAALMPGHILVLMDTGLAPSRQDLLLLPPDLLVHHRGRVWLPLETTLLEVSFHEACVRGAERIQLARSHSGVTFIDFEIAHDLHPPTLHRTTATITVDPNELMEAVAVEALDLHQHRQRHLERLAGLDSLQDATCEEALSAGVGLALNGLMPQARGLFHRAKTCDATAVQALNNLGNLALVEDRDPDQAVAYYEQALERNPEDGLIRVNMSMALLVQASTASQAEQRLALRQTAEQIAGQADQIMEELGQARPGPGEADQVSGLFHLTDWVHVLAQYRDADLDPQDVAQHTEVMRQALLDHKHAAHAPLIWRSSGD
jgi:hypothetical protein